MLGNYRITIESKNDRLTLAPYTPLRVLEGGLCGFDFPDTEVRALANAFGNGGYTTGGVIGSRRLAIYFEICDLKRLCTIRDRIVAMMNPGFKAKLYVNLYGRVRVIEALPAGMPEFDMKHMGASAKCRLNFVAEDPFFTDEENTEQVKLPQTYPILTFPLTIIKGAGTVCSFVTAKYFAKIYNPGDVECGFRATLKAVHGDVVNPGLSMNGKFLTLGETVKTGDEVMFDTRQGKRRITVNSIASYRFDLNSTFFALPPGYSYVYLSADSGEQNMDAVFEFTPLYMGV